MAPLSPRPLPAFALPPVVRGAAAPPLAARASSFVSSAVPAAAAAAAARARVADGPDAGVLVGGQRRCTLPGGAAPRRLAPRASAEAAADSPATVSVVVSAAVDAGVTPAILSAAAAAGAAVKDVHAAALGRHYSLAVELDVSDVDAGEVLSALAAAAVAVGATVVAADGATPGLPPPPGSPVSPAPFADAADGLSGEWLVSPPAPVASAATMAATTSYVVTLLAGPGGPLGTRFLAGLTELLASHGGMVRRVGQLARSPLQAMEVVVALSPPPPSVSINGDGVGDDAAAAAAASVADASAPAVVALRKALFRYCKSSDVDMALQADTVTRRAKRLVVMDMDSTLIRQEVIDELARHAGVYEAVRSITDAAMGGGMDFNESLRQRVALLAGTPAGPSFDAVMANLVYTDGAATLCSSLRQLGVRLAVISGGFATVAASVQRELGLHYHHANTLEVGSDGAFTGRTVGPVVNSQRKADLLVSIAEAEGIPLDQVVAIGDGANDLPMLSAAGLGIAFNAKPAVQDAAAYVLNQESLAAVLYLLGYSEGEQEELASRAPPQATLSAATASAAAAAAVAGGASSTDAAASVQVPTGP
ncbi:hypothetical protein I4F81_004900 [Pyropia yezoensis]|uniref:Uncharacterized protein n=1 Tax=Pyropia yezoensis TaxID=2788 RepID=A0ACC3BXX6_PYRYE|nr:hypothetical protein I4F81_004900 [Neopyropia yezoensis]